MYKLTNPHAENFLYAVQYLTVPRWWLELVGYWGAPGSPPSDKKAPSPIHPINVPSYDSIADYKKIYHHYEPNMNAIPYSWPYSCKSSESLSAASLSSASNGWMGVVAGALVGAGLMLAYERTMQRKRNQYMPIN